MTPTLDAEAGLRRAALALHAVNRADRSWLLRRLPRASRRTLGRLLAELRELKLPPDATLIREALHAPLDALGPEAQAHEHAMGRVLVREPLPAQRLLLASLPPARRQSLGRHGAPELILSEPAGPEPDWTAPLRQAVLSSWEELARQETP